MLSPPRLEARCRRGCGVAGVHPTIDDCLAAQRQALARLRPRPPPAVPIAPPRPIARPIPVGRGPRAAPTVIPRAVKAAIVAEMFLAPPGQLRTTARRLGGIYSLKAETIHTRWRQWARERAPETV